jgi:5-methyltetrahydrofolate--homocysteine methyltransferase
MRKEPTEAESVLWEALRRKGVEGMRFRRQRVIGPYIVDFCCLERRLIVEVDGHHHNSSDVAAYDSDRTRYLNTLGYDVVRVSNEDVLNNLNDIVGQIAASVSPFPFAKGKGAGG